MKDRICTLVKEFAKGVVDSESDVQIQIQDSKYSTKYMIIVPAAELGQVIGSNGSLIKSMRVIIKAMARKANYKKVYIDVSPKP